MGAEDVERQKPNVDRMRLLGAKVHPVTSGTGTLKDAMNEALRMGCPMQSLISISLALLLAPSLSGHGA